MLRKEYILLGSLALLLVLVLSNACLGQEFTIDFPDAKTVATIPDAETVVDFDVKQETPVVTVKIDEVSYKFSIDTGTNYSLISRSLARALKLKFYKLEYPADYYLSISGEHQYVTLPTLTLGSAQIRAVHCLVVDDDTFRKSGIAARGALGGDILHYFTLLLDYEHHHATFWRPADALAVNMKDVGFTTPINVPFTDRYHNYGCIVYFDLYQDTNHVVVGAYIDTGASLTVFPLDIIDVLKPTPVLDKGKGMQTADGVIRLYECKVAKMQMGEFTFENPTIYFPQDRTNHAIQSVGMDLLSHFDIFIDYGKHMLVLQPIMPKTTHAK